jgi:hypothetical protein
MRPYSPVLDLSVCMSTSRLEGVCQNSLCRGSEVLPGIMTLLMVYIPARHSMNRPTIDQKVVNELQFHRRDAVAVAALSYVRKRIKSVVKG